LKCNRALAALDLGRNNIGDVGVAALCEALKVNSTLTELGLGHNSFGEEGAKAVGDALTTNATLKELDLINNAFGDDGAHAILHALSHYNTSTYIVLLEHIDNAFNLEVCKEFFALGVANRAGIRLLIAESETDLSSKGIGAEGAEAIAKDLAHNTKVMVLILSLNVICDRGCQRITGALKTNSTLKSIWLDYNGIREDGS
jgi:Ran GTPase-activating protein (RanGAP) involved in mRNA processing and transport